LGTSGTVVANYASGLTAHFSDNNRPSRHRILLAIGGWLTSNPVPKMITSTSRRVLSAARNRARPPPPARAE